MASLAEIRAALKTTLKAAIPDLSVYTEVPSVNQVPAAVPMPAPRPDGMTCDFDGAFGGGLDTWTLDLFILVGYGDPALAQKALDQFVTGTGSKSIRRIIFETPDLGLADGTDAHAEGIREYGGHFASAGIPHVGAVVRLTVRTPST
ncbi:hypothetical protein DEJ49_33545 [Streptomyces venezuelae]|uniref:DUF3168 domain-containing protein n=1 Tax=Streptomyces venezuelae TaxID=54571 RepID=A0A5P2CQY7_STRVZ|nr:hypothetical protein [Streptomyces venezuelae]QES45265.1 hypothetical protein DEJ49_33545 [Streptomyces venezuelae]